MRSMAFSSLDDFNAPDILFPIARDVSKGDGALIIGLPILNLQLAICYNLANQAQSLLELG